MPKRKVIIVDDEADYRDGLREFLLRDAQVETFESPDAFAEVYSEPAKARDTYLMIIDFRFDTYNAHNKDLAVYIRDDLLFRGKLVLWSLEDDFPAEFSKYFDAILPKKIMSLYEIEQCLK